MDIEFDADAFLHLERIAQMVAEDVAEEIAQDAQRDAPKDTGQMAASVQAEGADVTVGTDHWQFVEYGTRHMPPQPFMRPATYKSRTLKRQYP